MQKAVDAVISIVYGDRLGGTTPEDRENSAKGLLKEMFGERAKGETLEELAATASQRWVRSQYQLADFQPGATGMVFTAKEAFELFGLKMMIEALDKGAAAFPRCLEIGDTIKATREARGWTQEYVALQTALSLETIVDVEGSKKQLSMNVLKIICDELGLDARTIGM